MPSLRREQVADDAVAHYKQAMGLRDLDKAVKGSTAGDTRVGLKETVDPKKFVTRVQKLYDSGRLEQALGKEGADALVKEAYAAKSAKSLQTVAKWSAGILAARYAGGFGSPPHSDSRKHDAVVRQSSCNRNNLRSGPSLRRRVGA